MYIVTGILNGVLTHQVREEEGLAALKPSKACFQPCLTKSWSYIPSRHCADNGNGPSSNSAHRSFLRKRKVRERSQQTRIRDLENKEQIPSQQRSDLPNRSPTTAAFIGLGHQKGTPAPFRAEIAARQGLQICFLIYPSIFTETGSPKKRIGAANLVFGNRCHAGFSMATGVHNLQTKEKGGLAAYAVMIYPDARLNWPCLVFSWDRGGG